MKILLLNDNPVVNKLVTLSAQKTSDELDIVQSIDDASEGKYDLLVVDDTLYTDTAIEELKAKVSYVESLYICSRDAKATDEFSKVIKKPFLPTDLVELFSTIGKEIKEKPAVSEDSFSLDDELEIADDEIDFGDNDIELSDDDLEISADDLDFGDDDFGEISLDDELELDDEVLSLDEPLEENLSEEEPSESVLDKDELQEVQDLLDMTEEAPSATTDEFEDLEVDNKELDLGDLDLSEASGEESLDLEDDLDEELSLELDDTLEDSINETPIELDTTEELDLGDDLEEDLDMSDIELGSNDLDEELSLELDDALEDSADETLIELDQTSEEKELVFELNDASESLEEEINLEDDLLNELEQEAELTLDDDIMSELDEELDNSADDEVLDLAMEDELEEELSLESEIEKAVGELSEEDLESEMDEDTLLDIVKSEIDSIDGLNARDLKIAMGEEVAPEEEIVEDVFDEELEALADTNSPDETQDAPEISDLEVSADNEGVESLKKLLEALSNKDVAASMKGMKISINIELGDK